MAAEFNEDRGANVRIALAFAFMTMSGACTAPINATSETPEFFCSVNGLGAMKPPISAEAICADFKSKIDAARGTKSEAVNALSLAANRDWLKLDIVIIKGRGAAAVLTRKTGAKQHVYPEVAIDVMDKPLGEQELERLAIELAKLVAENEHG
jgi:hypothetical protein